MFQQLWHACLLVGAVAYGIFVMNGDNPCEKSLNAASPISLITKIAAYPRFWSEPQRSSIQSGGDSAQTWFAGMVKDTFYDKSLACPKAVPLITSPAAGTFYTPLSSSPAQIDPNAPKAIPAPSANPAGLPDIPKELK